MQPFALALTQGSLLIRDAAESYALTTPTTISGDHDTGDVVDGVAPTGAVTNGDLTTPVISFETVALGLPVFVDATLAQVSPDMGTGVIDADGNVRFSTSMSVRLDIEVGVPKILGAVCETSPVDLVLDSTAPYNASTKRVTLRDPDFSVPAVPVTPTCESVVANNVNDLLAGGGHSLTMTLGGDLTLPPKADCPTLTDIDVAPADEARFGTDVTFTGTVTRDPAGIGTDDCDGVANDAIPPVSSSSATATASSEPAPSTPTASPPSPPTTSPPAPSTSPPPTAAHPPSPDPHPTPSPTGYRPTRSSPRTCPRSCASGRRHRPSSTSRSPTAPSDPTSPTDGSPSPWWPRAAWWTWRRVPGGQRHMDPGGDRRRRPPTIREDRSPDRSVDPRGVRGDPPCPRLRSERHPGRLLSVHHRARPG